MKQAIKSFLFRLLSTPLPIYLPVHGGWLYGWRILGIIKPYEPETVLFFKKRLSRNMIVADIGANCGFFTLLFSGLVKEVYAYEPDPTSFSRLHKTAKRLKNVSIFNVAIGNAGKQILYGQPGRGINSFYFRTTPIAEVTVQPLQKQFDFAKIDVEGAELDVLKNMPQCPCVVEYAPDHLPARYIDEIENMGYTIYVITKNGDIEPLDKTKLPKTGYCNLYLEP